MLKPKLSPVTFDGVLPPPSNRKSELEERKRALKKELEELEAEIEKG